MNYDDIQSAWRSPRNQPTRKEMNEGKMKLAAQLRRYRRRGIIVGAMSGAWTGGITALLVRNIMTSGTFVLAHQWAMFPLLALPWAVLLMSVFIGRRLRGGLEGRDYAKPVEADVRGMLRENRLAQMLVRILLAVHGLIVPVLAVAVWQWHASGKTRPHELVSMIVVFSVVIIASVGGLAWHWHRRLRVEQGRLETLVRAYEE